jgi:hypothetical protein
MVDGDRVDLTERAVVVGVHDEPAGERAAIAG